MKLQRFLFLVLTMVMGGIAFTSCNPSGNVSNNAVTTELRAPAYPLITIDPYTSAWSRTDSLYRRCRSPLDRKNALPDWCLAGRRAGIPFSGKRRNPLESPAAHGRL